MTGDKIGENKDSEKIPTSPEEYFEALVKEAPSKSGDHGISPRNLILADSPWFQQELIQEGKDFVKRNFYSVMLAHCISLLWVFTFKPGRAVLLRTGNSHVENSRDRYLSTILHIKLWYESDFIDKAAKGSQDIYGVRKQHAAAAKKYSKTNNNDVPEQALPDLPEKLKTLLQALQKELSSIEETPSYLQEQISGENPTTPVSQYAMAITQFCFIGFVTLMPQSFGIKDTKGLEGFIHNWAIYGRLLGMEDRFNLAVHFLTVKPECRVKAFSLIFQEIFLPNLKNVDATAMYMWDGLLKGFQHYMTGLRLKALVYFMVVYGADVQKPERLKEVMNWKDRFSFYFIKFFTHSISGSKFGRNFRNNGVRFSFARAERRYLPKWKQGNKK